MVLSFVSVESLRTIAPLNPASDMSITLLQSMQLIAS